MSHLHRTIFRRLNAQTPQRVSDESAAPAAVAITVVPVGHGGEILFIKRAVRVGDRWSGQMALPGGRFDDSDSDLMETAIRETKEETGVELTRGMVLGELDDLRPTTPSLPPVLVRPFVFGLPERPIVIPNDEVAGHVWIDLGDLAASEKMTTVEIKDRRLTVPAFVLEPHIIWGMTHRIIKPFLELVNNQQDSYRV